MTSRHTPPVPAAPEHAELAEDLANRVAFNDRGLVPAIVQDATTGRVLMMAWMNDHALAYTLATGRGTYWSRSRRQYWIKGETSGCFQTVVKAELDCDGDTVLLQVNQTGGACHTGATSCFDTLTLSGASGPVSAG